MGITISDINLVETALVAKPDIKYVCELGSQNLYLPGLSHARPPFASEWYIKRGLEYQCIDLAGDNLAMKLDLAQPIFQNVGKFDLVTDFGTSEHVTQVKEIQTVQFHDDHIHSIYPAHQPTVAEIKNGFYYCWRNKHQLLAVGGLMISVNPKTGNWPGHGYTYLVLEFYDELVKLMGYEKVWIGDSPAMGNIKNGWNVECILRKVDDREFISFIDFQSCPQLLN